MENPDNGAHEWTKTQIMKYPLKKNYKILLDTNVTASYSGSQFDARFPVDLNQIIREPWRLKSSYRMTFEFISKASTFAVGGVTSTNIYSVHIDLGKGTPTMFRYTNVRVPAGIVRVSNDGSGVFTTTAGVADIPVYFNSRPQDNDPLFIDDLLNISNININLIQAGSGTFNSADNAGINTATKYICCINLQEL